MPESIEHHRGARRHRPGGTARPRRGWPSAGATGAVAAAAAFILALAGCADWAVRTEGPALFWIQPVDREVRQADVASRGPAVPRTPNAYGPRTLVDLLGPAAGAMPVAVEVPAIGVGAPVIGLGLNGDGTLDVPDTAHQVGWYTGSPRPGEQGPAVLAGHVQLGRRTGVFTALRDLEPGELAHVHYDDGTVFTFVVYAREQYPKRAFPTVRAYGDVAGSELRLITCGGDLDRATRHHLDNVVIYADLVHRR